MNPEKQSCTAPHPDLREVTPPSAARPTDDPSLLRKRLLHSLERVPVSTDERRQVMRAWLEYLWLAGQTETSPLVMTVTAAADLSSVTWNAIGPNPTFSNALNEIFTTLEVAEEETACLLDALLTCEPARMGAWINLARHGFDGGWLISAPMPLHDVLRWVPARAPIAALLEWAHNSGIDTCSLLRRSVGEGRPYAELRVPLPADTPDELSDVLARAIAVLRMNPITRVVQAVGAALDASWRSRVDITLRLFAGGVARFGLAIPDPPAVLIDELCSAARLGDRSSLRAFERDLNVIGPRTAELSVSAEGLSLELHYNPFPAG